MNTARVARVLGADVHVVVALGGPTGAWIRDALNAGFFHGVSGASCSFVLSGFSWVAVDIVVRCLALPQVQLTRWVIRGERPST